MKRSKTPPEVFQVGDNVQFRRGELPYLRRGDTGQIVKLEGRGKYQKAYVQSYEPIAGDGRWWIFCYKLKKIDISGKKCLSVGDKVDIDHKRYVVAQIDESLYTLVSIQTGAAFGSPISTLYLEDFLGGTYDSSDNSNSP